MSRTATLQRWEEFLADDAGDFDADFLAPTPEVQARCAALLNALPEEMRAPTFSAAGIGDARLRWRSHGREVRVSLGPSRNYLYWQHGDRYGGEHEVNPRIVQHWLLWLEGIP